MLNTERKNVFRFDNFIIRVCSYWMVILLNLLAGSGMSLHRMRKGLDELETGQHAREAGWTGNGIEDNLEE